MYKLKSNNNLKYFLKSTLCRANSYKNFINCINNINNNCLVNSLTKLTSSKNFCYNVSKLNMIKSRRIFDLRLIEYFKKKEEETINFLNSFESKKEIDFNSKFYKELFKDESRLSLGQLFLFINHLEEFYKYYTKTESVLNHVKNLFNKIFYNKIYVPISKNMFDVNKASGLEFKNFISYYNINLNDLKNLKNNTEIENIIFESLKIYAICKLLVFYRHIFNLGTNSYSYSKSNLIFKNNEIEEIILNLKKYGISLIFDELKEYLYIFRYAIDSKILDSSNLNILEYHFKECFNNENINISTKIKTNLDVYTIFEDILKTEFSREFIKSCLEYISCKEPNIQIKFIKAVSNHYIKTNKIELSYYYDLYIKIIEVIIDEVIDVMKINEFSDRVYLYLISVTFNSEKFYYSSKHEISLEEALIESLKNKKLNNNSFFINKILNIYFNIRVENDSAEFLKEYMLIDYIMHDSFFNTIINLIRDNYNNNYSFNFKKYSKILNLNSQINYYLYNINKLNLFNNFIMQYSKDTYNSDLINNDDNYNVNNYLTTLKNKNSLLTIEINNYIYRELYFSYILKEFILAIIKNDESILSSILNNQVFCKQLTIIINLELKSYNDLKIKDEKSNFTNQSEIVDLLTNGSLIDKIAYINKLDPNILLLIKDVKNFIYKNCLDSILYCLIKNVELKSSLYNFFNLIIENNMCYVSNNIPRKIVFNDNFNKDKNGDIEYNYNNYI